MKKKWETCLGTKSIEHYEEYEREMENVKKILQEEIQKIMDSFWRNK